jgi:hypothetical protein
MAHCPVYCRTNKFELQARNSGTKHDLSFYKSWQRRLCVNPAFSRQPGGMPGNLHFFSRFSLFKDGYCF